MGAVAPGLTLVACLCGLAGCACPRPQAERPAAKKRRTAVPPRPEPSKPTEPNSNDRDVRAMFRGGVKRRGQTRFRLPRQSPSVLWRHATSRPIFASPVVDHRGNVFVGSLDGSVVSLTPAGELRWRHEAGGKVFASPALGPRGVVVGSDSDRVILLDAESGSVAWTFQLGPCPTGPGLGPDTVRCDADSSALVASDGTIYVGGDGLYALSPDGELRWRLELGGHAFSSPAMGPDGALYLGTQANTVVAVSPAGQKRWVHRGRADFDATPALVDEATLVIGCDDGHLYALATRDGSVRWSVNTRRPVRSSAAVGPDGTIYVGSDSGRLWALGPGGQVKWRYATDGPIRSSPTVDPEGVVVFGSQDHHLYGLDAGGQLLWKVRLDGDVDSSVAVAADGTLYVGADSGQLYALR